MKVQTNKNDDIYASILSIAKEGASKKEIAEALSMSYQQLRAYPKNTSKEDIVRE